MTFENAFSQLPPWLDQGLGVAVALGAGLLIGLEREQRRKDDSDSQASHSTIAGVRTFALIALAGAMSALIGTSLIAVGAGFIALIAVMSYRSSRAADPLHFDPGLTTEVAMYVTFLLGAMAISKPALAAAIGVGVALLLSLRTAMHRFSREWLTPVELHDALLLIAAALIVLPLIPNHPIDPWQIFNPHKIWRLVVLVMLINALGYVAQRTLGMRLGLPLAGLAGGFVSAIATIGAMGARAKTEPAHFKAFVAAASMANIATIAQFAAIFATISMPLLKLLQWPLIFSGVSVLCFASFFGLSAWKAHADSAMTAKGRAFEPKVALAFAALLSVVMIFSALLRHYFGDSGAIVAAAVSGLVDTHASAGALAQMADAKQLSMTTAALGVLAGLVTNITVKLVVAFSIGGKRYGLYVAPGLIALTLAFAVTLYFQIAT